MRRILIANRGEIVSRIARTCRAMGIDTVGIYADPDRTALYVRHVDEAVCIGPPMGSATFLAIDLIVDVARRTGADAVHPGYGFLAENADFAQACATAGLIFIGPSPEAIRRMGSKIEAKRIAAAAGVPTVPGFDAAGLSDAEIASRAEQVGFPVLIKASFGGGGKGMRIVRDAAALSPALEAARREAAGSFGDDALLVERYVDSPRHVEIQILGDHDGNLVHCFERECSIQRRYQKIIEEAPSPAVDSVLRTRMGAAAVAVGKAIGYANAGTVEFILDPQGNFYFLEVNTRLQVEHPVTEMVTGLDLVRLQIEIARGRPLPFRQEDLRLSGHAIECRIYAEDPRNGFLPSTGTLACWEEAVLPGLRYESGVETGSAVTIHYDPMLAKVIAHAPSRPETAQRLAKALASMRVHGVQTNVGLLVEILRHPAFITGHLDTHFIETHLQLDRGPGEHEKIADREHALALALWQQARRRDAATVMSGLPSGWRNNPSRMQDVVYRTGDETIAVEYQMERSGSFDAIVDGAKRRARIVSWSATEMIVEVDQIQRRVSIVRDGEDCHLHSALGVSKLRQIPRFREPGMSEDTLGGCCAPMPGKVLAVRVAAGDSVVKGQTLVILEAMKMEHDVAAPADGVVERVAVEAGQQVDAGAVLVIIGEVAPT